MLTVTVSSLSCSDIHFLQPGVKINAEYHSAVLHKMLLPDIRRVSGDLYTFQQDNAPAHRAAHATIEILKTETPDFIPPDLGHQIRQI